MYKEKKIKKSAIIIHNNAQRVKQTKLKKSKNHKIPVTLVIK